MGGAKFNYSLATLNPIKPLSLKSMFTPPHKCEQITNPFGANCTANVDPTYNFNCADSEDPLCLNPNKWAIFTDTAEG